MYRAGIQLQNSQEYDSGQGSIMQNDARSLMMMIPQNSQIGQGLTQPSSSNHDGVSFASISGGGPQGTASIK